MLAVRLPPTVPSDLGVQVAYQKEFSNACVSCARGMIFDGQFDRSVRSAAFEQQQQHHNAQDAYAGASPDESLASEDSLAAATERSSTPPNTDALRAIANPQGPGRVRTTAGLGRSLPFFSIRASLAGANVFLTGATGYLGQLILEQLLRTVPELGCVFVLSRGKRDLTARQRINKILYSGLFHAIRCKPTLLSKVVVVEGDLLLPNMGLSRGTLLNVLPKVSVVIHSAARIALQDALVKTVRNNYCTTDLLLKIATKQMKHLKAFVFVSSAYVNVNLPNHSTAMEAIHPHMRGDQEIEHSSLVAELLSLSEEDSQMKEAVLCSSLGYPNTYTLGKHLTECLVRSYTQQGLPGVIVRPSLVAAVAGRPYPGFAGNLSGPAGLALAYATGFYANMDVIAWHPESLLDSVPGDVASSMIIAAAALRVSGCNTNAELFCTAEREAMKSSRGSGEPSGSAPGTPSKDSSIPRAWGVNIKTSSTDKGLVILHTVTSTTNPFSNGEAFALVHQFFQKNVAKKRVMLGRYPKMDPTYVPDAKKVNAAVKNMSFRVNIISRLLSCFGYSQASRKLNIGFQAFKQSNDAKYSTTIYYSAKGALALETILNPAEADDFPLVWRGDWRRYANTYCAGLCKLFMQQDAVTDGSHDFAFISDLDPPSIL